MMEITIIGTGNMARGALWPHQRLAARDVSPAARRIAPPERGSRGSAGGDGADRVGQQPALERGQPTAHLGSVRAVVDR